MARKQVETGEIEAIAATLQREERAVAMGKAPFEAERDHQLQLKAEQEHREQMIAQCHEMIGQIKGFRVISQFADVGNLVWLRQVKESKIYKDLPNLGTWDKFCNYIGLSRSKVDEDITNLATFGESFLADVGKIGLGYRELRQLRQLTHDGSVIIDAETITIDGVAIPFNEDHADEVQAAIESIISSNAELNKKVNRLVQDMNGIVKEETKGLKIEKDALLQEVKRLKAFDPEDKDRDWSVAMMDEVRMAAVSLESTLQRFVIDPRIVGDRPLQAQVWAYLNAATAQLEDLDKRMRDAYYVDED